MPYYHSDSSITDRITPIPTPEEIFKSRDLELSLKTKDVQSETIEDIIKNMCLPVPKKDDVSLTDEEQKEVWKTMEDKIKVEKANEYEKDGCIEPMGSNANWGRITQREQIGGQALVAETPHSAGSIDYQYQESPKCKLCTKYFAPHLNVFSPEGFDASCCNSCNTDVTLDKTDWYCKGCSKYFTTKASLKRHHDRKKSCKEICEKKEDLSGSMVQVPDKPYIVDWVDIVLKNAISGPSVEAPYCQFCEVEFANKSNLNKHLSKSMACDKLAKQEFLKSLHKMLKE